MPVRYRVDITFGPRTVDVEAVRVAKRVQDDLNRELSRMASLMLMLTDPNTLRPDPRAANLKAAMSVERNAGPRQRDRARAITDRLAEALQKQRQTIDA